ncbi:MAG TPA: Ig-like domain-containing protein, partial [Planctomycetota bacterium]
MRSFHGPRWFRALSRLLCVALSAVSLVHCDAVLALAAAPARPQPLPLPRLSPASFLLQAAPLTLTRISTPFNNPIGIDHHSPTNRVVISANYPSGQPSNFELVAADGSRSAFSNIKGLTDEIKIATAKDSLGGFTAGELFTGTGVPGVIARISPDGLSVQNPWVTLPNEFGLMRGSLYVDRTGVFGGDLIAVTTNGGVWRVSSAGVARKLAQIPAHLEGVHTIPNDPARYGPWAGKILAGAEGQGRLYTIDPAGVVAFSALGINPEDIDIIPPGENFYGVDFSGGRLWGAPASAFADMVGDFLIAQEFPGHLWHVRWDGTKFVTRVLATVSQWEHVTFSPAGLVEIPPAGQPPTKTCPPPVTVESTSPAGATVVLSTDVSDPDAGPLQVRWNVDGGPVEAVDTIPTTGKPTTGTSSFSHLYPIGAHQVTLIVSDGVLEARCETTVTVTDNVPPVISCELDTKLLWPPKHEMVDVGLRISASDSSGTPRISIAVFSDEDDEDKTGDGKHSPDAVVLPTAGVGRVPLFLRAEREGDRDGRTYLILITATDPLGNSSFHCCTVIVPDNQSPASVARAEAQAALAEATCTATGSPVTPFKVGDGPVLGPKQTPAPALSFLSVEPANPVLSVGATLALKATGVFADGSVQDLTAEALWTSSAPSVASVDATGRATGVAAGETLVTASARGLSGSTTLTVSTAAAAALIVAPEWARLFTSTSYGYAAFRRLADGTLEDVTTLAAWSSDDASIASVAAGGLVSTVAPGSTRIVATLGGLSGEGAIHVIPRALLTLAVSPSTASIVEGQTRSFSASGFFNDGTTRNVTTEVAWSADPAVASVNASGLALGIDPGTTAVVASRDGVSASGSLTVVARKVVSITLAPPNANLVAGLTLQYTATGSFNDGTTENINASAEWSS